MFRDLDASGRPGTLDRRQPAPLPSAQPVDQESAGLRARCSSRSNCSTARGRPCRGAAFAMFCGLSGVVYLINDVVDRESDRQPPAQAAAADCRRARCRSAAALAAAALLAVGGPGRGLRARLALRAPWPLGYLALQSLYSGPLKHIVIIDVLTLAHRVRAARDCRCGGHRRRDQPLAVRLHHPAGAVHRAGQAAARARAARRRRHQPSPDSRRVQRLPPRSDDRRRHRVDPDRVHLLHHQPGDRAEVRHRRGWA